MDEDEELKYEIELQYLSSSKINDIFGDKNRLFLMARESNNRYEYTDALEYIKIELAKIRSGRGLKEWCLEFDLTYQTTINLLNGKTKTDSPDLLYKILKALGHEVEAYKVIYFECSPELPGISKTVSVRKTKVK